jgi:hypothetical protein
MGDGVNIAARLQSEAEPGGVCLSQIVYDVVKKRLALQATYLGPRELKHIQEAVPIYQIVLAAQSKTTNLQSELERTLNESGGLESGGLEVDESQNPPIGNQPAVSPLLLTNQVKESLERLLIEAIGPIAPVLLQQALKQAQSHQDLVEHLLIQLPTYLQNSFRDQANSLLKSMSAAPSKQPVPQPVVRKEVKVSTVGTVTPEFVKRCELELTKAIGPIASVIVQRALAQQPEISCNQLIEVLAEHLPNSKAIEAFRKQLLTPS